MRERIVLQTTTKAKILRLHENGESSFPKNQQPQQDSPAITTTLTQEQLVKMMQIIEEIRVNGTK
ncbi:hypothetical protein [Lysinibacillus sp. C5.1]|uniref:hypothetical protein n=1 Tax=Lysinibacillus sp. C5.1 TaxID=2796169 RepID=UPI003081555B